MTKAREPWHCHFCGTKIPQGGTHYALYDKPTIVWGYMCCDGRDVHRQLWPDCTVSQHDFHDHGDEFAIAQKRSDFNHWYKTHGAT